jgi:hypothetical protein
MALVDDASEIARRSETRERVEIFAKFRRDRENVTIVLKDLSSGGARLEGIEGLTRDEVVTITLPGRKPMIAFVAWASGMSAGVEFADALTEEIYTFLVDNYALGRRPTAAA